MAALVATQSTHEEFIADSSSIQQKGDTTMLAQLRKMSEKAQGVLRNERGQGLVEYALILVLIAVVVNAAVRGIGNNANQTFSTIGSNMK